MFRATLLGIGILTAATLAACSSTPSHVFARRAAAAAPGACASASRARPGPGSSGCNAFTRTYSGEQLRATGVTNVALALQMLDPSITAGGGH